MGELLEGASGFIIHSHIHPVNGALAVALASPGYANEVGDSWGGEGKGGCCRDSQSVENPAANDRREGK